MTSQTENAIARYRRNLETALAAAPPEVRAAAIQDADEFLVDEVQAMDVGRLTSESAAYDRFVERFGTPQQLAASYLEQHEPGLAIAPHSVNRTTGGWKRFAAMLLLTVIVTGGIGYSAFHEPPKVSPFTNVVFKGDQVFVVYEGKHYQWLELDDLTVPEIVKSAKKQFGDLWQKRVAEDLVEVLWGMDHRPSDTVRLRLSDPTSHAEQVIAAAPMTAENRRSVYVQRDDVIDTPQAKVTPKLSPFTEVTFSSDQIVVTYEGKSHQWLELDHLSVDEIVAASKQQFGDLWQKRVAEDLVEVLWAMDHRPQGTVRLRLIESNTKEERVIAAAPMTEDNRRALYRKRTDEITADPTRTRLP